MPQIQVKIPHQIGQAGARVALERSLKEITEKHAGQLNNLAHAWDGQKLDYSFSTMGLKIAGTMRVEPTEVAVSATIPFAALLFKGKIEAELRDRLTKILTSPAAEQV